MFSVTTVRGLVEMGFMALAGTQMTSRYLLCYYL